jgi:hypothetical protein
MISGAGWFSRPLIGALLLLALSCAWTPPAVMGAENGIHDGSAVAPADPATPVLQSPCLKRDFVPPYLPGVHLDLAYAHPLTMEIAYDPRTLGPTGCLDLPGNRRLRSGLEFALILHGEVRRLAPEASGATLTVTAHPGWISEEWTWPDGLNLQRVYFQPAGSEALGVRCVLNNRTPRTLSGVRLAAQLSNPDLAGRSARGGPHAGFSDLEADPRSETLVLRDVQTDEEGVMALGWGPQGGFMGSGGYTAEDPLGSGKSETHNPADVAVSLETPAWDVYPNQSREAVFWITWGLEADAATHTLAQRRQNPGFGAWEKKAGAAGVQGVRFECRDPQAAYWFCSAKAWAVWMRRSDEFGNAFLYSPHATEPVRPAALAGGALGWQALGQSPAFKQHLENWLDQKYEPADTANLVLAMHAYFLWTHNRPWLAENAARLEDMLNALADMDINGDGLPEQSQGEAAGTGPVGQGASRSLAYQGLATSVLAVVAFRQGAELLAALGKENLPVAAKFRAYAQLGEQTFKGVFWNPQAGVAGFYAYARSEDSRSLVRSRSLGALTCLSHHLGPVGFQKAAWRELWENQRWRTAGGAWRSMPADEPAYRGDQTVGQGGPDTAATLELLRLGLSDPAQAAAAADAFLNFARHQVGDPAVLGGLRQQPGQSVDVDFENLKIIELFLQGLAGLDFSLEGLRVHVPPYPQDLGVRLENLAYAGARLQVEVKGAGAHGRIFVNHQPWDSTRLLPRSLFAQGKVRIVIEKEP